MTTSDTWRPGEIHMAEAKADGCAARAAELHETHTEELYAELLHRAEHLLSRGESVVLDASWTSAPHRAAAAEVAGRTSSELLQLQCRAGADTAARRIVSRIDGPSDATLPVATLMSDAADPWPEAAAIDTAGPVAAALEQAAAFWRDAAG